MIVGPDDVTFKKAEAGLRDTSKPLRDRADGFLEWAVKEIDKKYPGIRK